MDHDLKDAQAHLPELFARALKEGPQRITRRGETVVVVSEQEWAQRVSTQESFKDHLLSIPLPRDFQPPPRDRLARRPIDLNDG